MQDHQRDIIYEQSSLKGVPITTRFEKCKDLLKNSDDESLRVEAVWIIGNIAEEVGKKHPLYLKVVELLVDVLKNDDNAIVRHEAGFQIGEHNMKSKLSALIDAAHNDPNPVVRHECIEAMGLLRAPEARSALKKSLDDPDESVSLTAKCILKQLDRFEDLEKNKQHETPLVK